MMRRIFATVSALAIASLIGMAQSPAGWMVRADRSTSATDPDGAGAIQFTEMDGGFHAVNPQAAVYWNDVNSTSGDFTLKGTFTLVKPSGHPNYYGLVFGGSDLGGSEQTYVYFLVAQNGTWLVKQRVGNATAARVGNRFTSPKPAECGQSDSLPGRRAIQKNVTQGRTERLRYLSGKILLAGVVAD